MQDICTNEQYVHEQLFHLFRKIPTGQFINGQYKHVFADTSVWESTMRSVLEILELEYNQIYNISKPRSFTSNLNTVDLKPYAVNKIFFDVYEITYMNLYPEIMKRMDVKNENIAINIKKLITEMFKFRKAMKSKLYLSMTSAYKTINETQLQNDYDAAQLNAKIFINYIYGNTKKCKYLAATFSISEYVRSEMHNMWSRIDNYLGDDLLYFDTDTAYVIANDHTEDEIFKAFDSALISYEYETKPCIGFHRKKMIYKFPDKIPYFEINNTKITPIN